MMYREERKDRMLLYRHGARCPYTIQRFLKHYPSYWCFIPITINEAMQHDANYIPPASIVVHDNVNPTSIGSRNRRHVRQTSTTRSDEDVRSCMRQLPPLPIGFTFSVRQRVAQFQYFKNKVDLDQTPHDTVNLFNANVIAVCK